MLYNFFILLSASDSPATVFKAVIATVDDIFKQGDGPHDLPMPLSNPPFIFCRMQRKLETESNYTASMNLAWDCCLSDYKESDM